LFLFTFLSLHHHHFLKASFTFTFMITCEHVSVPYNVLFFIVWFFLFHTQINLINLLSVCSTS